MPFKIIRNDITKMTVDAIVNTANEAPMYSSGTDTAVYQAAGEEELLKVRKEIGYMQEGEAAITPGFKLPAKYIIHAVSPRFLDGKSGEEEKLRSCYKKSLALAKENHCESIAFPLISTGSFGYPKEEGMRIAVDEIHAFLLKNEMLVYLVVFDTEATKLGKNLYPDLEAYIDHKYVCDKWEEEYLIYPSVGMAIQENVEKEAVLEDDFEDFLEKSESAIAKRMLHLSDTFQEYLFYLIEQKGLTNADVYKRAIMTKQLFSKIKNNPQYHPDKDTALKLCIGAKLNLDETKDLLARAGYALSPCDKKDIIFTYFIERGIYNMIDIDIVLEEFGLPCFIE